MADLSKGILLIFPRLFIFKEDSFNFRFPVIEYKHDLTSLYLKTDLKALIEIPILNEFSKFDLKIEFFQSEEKLTINKTFFFKDFNLKHDSTSSFSYNISNEDKEPIYLIMDAYFYRTNAAEEQQEENSFIIKVDLIEGMEVFFNMRKKIQKAKHGRTKSIYDYRYFLEFLYMRQKFAFEITPDVNEMKMHEIFLVTALNQDDNLRINV